MVAATGAAGNVEVPFETAAPVTPIAAATSTPPIPAANRAVLDTCTS
jgi:hypothetical protein